MTDDIAKRFELVDREVDGRMCKVFAEAPGQLSELFSALDEFADREFVVDGQTRLTYAAVKQRAANLASELQREFDLGAGERVAIALPNSAEWIITFIAVSSLGAVPALVNARAAADELIHAVQSTNCRLLIAEQAPDGIDAPLVTTQQLVEWSAQGSASLPFVAREPGDEAILMFTSGTTGRAKAAILTHLGVITALKTIEYSGVLIAQQMAERYQIELATLMQMRPPAVTLLMFPLFHVSGCHAVFLSALRQGGKLVLLRRWDVDHAIETIAAEKVTQFPAVPTMYWDLLNRGSELGADLSSLTNLSVGGQATPPALLSEMSSRFPQAVMGTGYGMTEANGTVSMVVGDDFIAAPDTVGRPIATAQVEVRDETGTSLAAGEIGEIFVRGATLMKGYANAPGPYFDDAGWFATGDIGRFDDNGVLQIVDRRTDMVISGGENIYCAEVQNAIDLHPAVRESAAFGEPDERLGERVIAVAVLEAGATASSEEILASLDTHIARYKVPKALHLRAEPLPRNPSGKIIKRQVRERYRQDTST